MLCYEMQSLFVCIRKTSMSVLAVRFIYAFLVARSGSFFSRAEANLTSFHGGARFLNGRGETDIWGRTYAMNQLDKIAVDMGLFSNQYRIRM